MFKNISEFNKSYRVHRLINLHSINYQLYIDSKDLLGMISGLKSLIQYNKFNEKEFTSNNTLIRALIYEGKIKDFKILLPHEDEILYNIERYKTIYDDVSEEEKGEIYHYFKKITGIEIDGFLKNSNINVLRELEKNGQQLFIVKYLLNINNWKQRLKYLWQNNIYQTDTTRYDYEKIIKSSLFNTILNKGFEVVRAGYKNSNIVDSIVLCILHKKLQLHKKNKKNYFPLFYDPTNLFRNVIKAAEIEKEFMVEINSHEISILQSDSFILLSALSSTKDPKIAITDENYEEYKKYKNIIKDLAINTNNSIDKHSLKQINKYVNKKFLTLFWKSYENESINFFKELRAFLTKKTIKERVESDIIDIINEIRLRINYYSIFRKTYTTLLHRHKEVKRIFTENINKIGIENLNIFRDYGLTRFSLSQTNCRKLNEVTKELFNETDEYSGQLTEHLSYVGRIITNGYLKTDKKTQEELVIGLAILWILNKYDLIIQILDTHKKYFHYSLAFIYASSLAKHKNDNLKTKKAISILDFVNKNYPFKYNYKTSIGASYVYYHLWENNNDNSFRATLKEPSFCGKKNGQNYFLRKAIQLAEIAIEFLKKDNFYQEKEYRKNKYYYIINNYIYYITMGMCDEKFNKLDEYVNIIENIKATDNTFWEYRFDDTLSLYYLRKGIIEKDITYIKNAKEHNVEAMNMVLIEDDKRIIELTSKKIDRVNEKTLPNIVYKALGNRRLNRKL